MNACYEMYFNRQGDPIDIQEYARLFEDFAYKVVQKTQVQSLTSGALEVSTMWLGADHSFRTGGPPLIFETMVFGLPDGQHIDRYPTEMQARKGHNDAIEWARIQ